jgi:hypothetical protein
VIPVYRSHSAAVVARDKLRKRFPDAEGSFVVVYVELQEKESEEPDMLLDEGDEDD